MPTKQIYFKYKKHPGDLFRSTDVTLCPNPEEDLESFLIQFLEDYQSNDQIAYIDDLHKILRNEFEDEMEKYRLCELAAGKRTKDKIEEEIQLIENELIFKAYKNFYHLIITNEIEIIIK